MGMVLPTPDEADKGAQNDEKVQEAFEKIKEEIESRYWRGTTIEVWMPLGLLDDEGTRNRLRRVCGPHWHIKYEFKPSGAFPKQKNRSRSCPSC